MMSMTRVLSAAAALAALLNAAPAALAAAANGLYVPVPKTAPSPADNPSTTAKVELGKLLFFDPRISSSGSVSCNSCHNLMGGGDDGLATSVGVKGQTGKRSAPTVWNSGLLTAMFWDGRAPSLEEQAKGPMTNPIEMGMSSHDMVVSRLRKVPGYVQRFTAVYGKENPLNIDNAAKAIAAFERTLNTPDSAFDRYLKGDKKALSASAQRGLKVIEETGCTSCHQGVDFAGPALPAGQGFFQKFPTFPGTTYAAKYHLEDDLGRYEATKKDEDKHMWRVPTWRNIALTAPYFHNGSVATLDEAVRVMAKTQLDKELSDDDVKSVVAFLESLTGKFPEMSLPRLPPTPGRSVVVSDTAASH